MVRLSSPPRILIVRLSALGDVIHTLPVLATLRHTYPNAMIGWLVEPEAAVLLEHHPDINHLHIWNRRQWLHWLKSPRHWSQLLHALGLFQRELAHIGYDVVVDTQGLFKSGLISYLSQIPQRLGFAGAREGASLFYNRQVKRPYPEKSPTHVVTEAYFELTKAMGCDHQVRQYPLPPPSVDSQQLVDKHLHTLLPNRPMIVIAPATTWVSKTWPEANWRELVLQLTLKTPANLVFVGTADDHNLVHELIKSVPTDYQRRCKNLAGHTTLPQLQALLNQADVVVGCDSLTVHLAGALNRPRVVGLYGPTSWQRTPPPGPQSLAIHRLPPLTCMPCHQKTCPLDHHHCMTELTVHQVLSQLQALL